MAVDVHKSKSKRKRKSEEVDDGGSPAVPEKIAKMKYKKQETSTKTIQESEMQNEVTEALSTETTSNHKEEEVNQDSGFEETKFSKDIKIIDLRTKLRGTNFITELRHFLYVAQLRPKIVLKYLEKRGKPLELAEAFDRIDKTNVLHVAYLAEALQLVTMEIVSHQKQHMESAVYACRYFLKAHGAVLDLLLQSAQLQHRRIALKLLTAIVCVDPQLGRQLLSSYDILSNVKTIENFLSHSKFELKQEDTVRKCYIHFVLAYLVDGNTLLIRNILERGALIRALASGLLYDDHVTVCVVLNTLRQYVLQCPEISKTKKVQVFDLSCVKNFVRLYDWYGPKVYAAKFGGKYGALESQGKLLPEHVASLVDNAEREAVSAAVHEFLLELLTSRKHGITFDAVTHFRQKHNVIQGKIIGFIYKPWLDARKTELITKILHACPDLARHTVRNFASIVNPMRTPQRIWVQAVDFLALIIDTLHPKLLRGAFEQITLTDFSYWIKDICLPIETLVLLTGSKMLRHANYEFRLATNRLLLVMFRQYANYMHAIRQREQARGDNTLRRFKFDLLNHILVNFPTIENILYSLFMTTQMKNIEDADVLVHLDVTLDLILAVCKENRSFVNKTSTILDYLKLLRPLYAKDEEAAVAHEHIKLELKAVKTILLLFPKSLEPQEELFSSVLNSFIKAFVHGSVEVQREAGELLRGIFKNTGIFDAGELEIDLWLEPLRFCDADTVNVVTQVFIEVLQVTKAEVDAPKTAETTTNSQQLQRLFENIEQGLSVQAHIETLGISKLLPLIYKGVELAAPLDKYLETVCLLMYHYYPMPEYVLQLYDMEFKSLQPYMRSWLPREGKKSKPEMLPAEWMKCLPHLYSIQKAIVQGEGTFEQIFTVSAATEGALELELHGKTLHFVAVLQHTRLLLIYIEEAFFLVSQLVAQGNLQSTQASRAAAFISDALHVMRQLERQAEEDEAFIQACIKIEDGDSGEAQQQIVPLLSQTLHYIFGVRLTYIKSDEIFSANDETHLNYLQFLCTLTTYCNTLPHFDDYAGNYREKLVKALAISLQHVDATKTHSVQLQVCIQMLEAFQLTGDNCQQMLRLLSGAGLKYSDYCVAATQQPTFYYTLLVCLLQRLATLQCSVANGGEYLPQLLHVYTQLARKTELSLDALEGALYGFLCVSHQLIPQLDASCFDCMFHAERKLNKNSVRLACLLFERDAEKLTPRFLELLPQHSQQKELIYPLLDVALQLGVRVPAAEMQNIYQTYKSGLMKSIEKPQKAAAIYREHVRCSVALVQQCMPRSECVDYSNKQFKCDSCETYQMQLLYAIYEKALPSKDDTTATKQYANIFVNFVQLQVQLLTLELKKQNHIDAEKLALCAYQLQQWWPQPQVVNDYGKLLQNAVWQNFCKLCLRVSMQLPEETIEEQTLETHAELLKLLAFLCDRLYVDYVDEGAASTMDQLPAQLYEMICTHSKFYDILLRSHVKDNLKTSIMRLLYTLAKKNPHALQHTHIPILLGAYQARLNVADRYTLALLQLYEQHDCGLAQYRPYIWGESAIAFYALRAGDEERAKLQQQETSIAQVMSLVDRQLCEYTIDNFPIWRKLQPGQQLPPVEFPNPDSKVRRYGNNELERRIELADETQKTPQFETSELRLCAKKDGAFEKCYDPAFFVPLMSMCFAPEVYSHPARPVQNGLLALSFAALSSQDKEMRLAAANVQLRYRAHFEQSKFFERPLWLQTYENIQAGLNDLRQSWLKHKHNSGTPRVPYVSCLFVAKTLNLTTDPLHLLYKQLTMYLRLKNSFNFQCVPEFNVLFYSPEVEHQAFRQFIVEVIRHGVKCSSDLFLLHSTNTFKVLMGFYGSSMSTLDMNLHILAVFAACAKIPASSKLMLEQVGLLPWLHGIVSGVEFHQFDVIEGLISILCNFWYALRASAGEFHNYPQVLLDLHRLVLLLLPHLSARIMPESFARLLHVLHKTAVRPYQLAVTETQLMHLIDCTEKHFGRQLVRAIENIKMFGGAGVASDAKYCTQLHEANADGVAILALSSLRAYTIDWWQCRHEQKQVPQE